jgi:hypothetical protein
VTVSTPPGVAFSARTHTARHDRGFLDTTRRSMGTAVTFAPGDMVGERYRVVRYIARGGMGEVYEVEDTALHERIALKTIRPETAEDSRAIERFKREIHIARKITHPNVCRVFDLGFHRASDVEGDSDTTQDLLFLTMELLCGETLYDRIARRRISPEEALPIIEQLALALDAAHGAGIIHRDLKSTNVMLVPDPRKGTRVVVTDFGLARGLATAGGALASISETGSVVGTASYMAPEQVEAKPLTAAADIYALGTILFEMLTQVRPFDGDGDTPLTVAVRRLTTPPPPPSRYVHGLDPRWERAILRCLEREPTARFPNASGLVEALRDRSASLPGAADVTVAQTAWPWDRTLGKKAIDPLRTIIPAAFVGLIYVLVVVLVKTVWHDFLPINEYLMSVGWPFVLLPLGLLIPGARFIRRSIFEIFLAGVENRIRITAVIGAFAISVALGGSSFALRPRIDVRLVDASIDEDATGAPPLANVITPTVRGDRLCRRPEDAQDPNRYCDSPLPADGYLRLLVHFGFNRLPSYRLRFTASPPSAIAFARMRLDRAIGISDAPERVRSAGGTIEIASGDSRSAPLTGTMEMRFVLRQLPGRLEADPRLRLSIARDAEGMHVISELDQCWSLADGRIGDPCDDSRSMRER